MTRTSICVAAAWLLAACGRPLAASFVPSLELGVRFTRKGEHQHDQGARAADLSSFVRLSFRARSEAAALLSVGEASGLALAAPCAEGDVACADELAEAERELAALGDDP
jgi:hypothetical protein